MTGQIPPYGKHFRLEQVPGYHPELAHRAYVLKAEPAEAGARPYVAGPRRPAGGRR